MIFKKAISKEIIFTNLLGWDFFPPKPAIKDIPVWYIDTPEYIGEDVKKITQPGATSHTVKKCIPVFDAMTSGYILYTQVDVQVTQVDGSPYYIWADQGAIEFHPIEQAPLHPLRNNLSYPKWINPYSIITPAGYSCLFIQPLHRESIFTILPGVVDTDKYNASVSFPFVLNDVKFEGIIPAGTPVAQVIPFKRNFWKHKIGKNKELRKAKISSAKRKTMFFNSYKKQFWTRKKYD